MQRNILKIQRRLAFVIPLIASMMVLLPGAQAGIVYYTTQSAFDAAAPGLPDAAFGGPTGTVATGPLGNAVPGITVTTSGGGSQNLVYEAGGIAPNYFGDTLVLNFSTPVTAVGVNVKGQYSGSSTSPAPLNTNIYLDGSSNPVSSSPTIAADTPYFFGATSTTPITSVSFLFDSQEADAWTVVPNVEFGNAASVPEPSSLVLLTTAASLCLIIRTSARKGTASIAV